MPSPRTDISIEPALNSTLVNRDGLKKSLATVPYSSSGVEKVTGFTADANNSTTATLAADAVFTGTATDVSAYDRIRVTLKMSPNVDPDGDASTAAGSLSVQFSPDAINWDVQISIYVRSGIFIPQSYVVIDKYFRLVYTNDGGASAITNLGLTETASASVTQTAFRLNSILFQAGVGELGRTIDQAISGSDPVSLIRAVSMGKTPAGVYANIPLGGEDTGSRTTTALTNTTIGTFTVDAGTDVCTLVAHGLSDGDDVVLSTSDTLPAGLAVDTQYFIVSKTDDTFKLSASSGGAAIDITDTGTGTHTIKEPGTFTGGWQSAQGFASMLPFAFGLEKFSVVRLRWSPDASTDRTGLLTLSSLSNEAVVSAGVTFQVYISLNTTLIDKFFRLELVNGSDDQTSGSMEATVWMYDKPFTGSFAGLNSVISTLSTSLLTRAVVAGVRPDGTTFKNASLNEVDNLMVTDFLTEVGKGNITKHSFATAFGSSKTSGITTSFTTVWQQGGIYNWKTSATTLKISSSSDTDAAAQTGALTMRITGLDANYLVITEDITLTGQTQVTTSKSYLRINSAEVLTAGSGGENVGDIYVYTGTATSGVPDTATNVLRKIAVGFNSGQAGAYTIPAAMTGYLKRLYINVIGGKLITMRLRARPLNGVFDVTQTLQVSEGLVDQQFVIPISFAAKTDIDMMAKVSTGTTEANAGFSLLLVED